MAIGGTFLSAVFQIALGKLASPTLRELGSRIAVDKVKKLIRALSKIQAVLSNAEARQTADKAVKEWLIDVTEAAYDVEDVLGEVMTEAFRLKLQNPVSNLSSLSMDFRFEVRSKLEEINKRLDEYQRKEMSWG